MGMNMNMFAPHEQGNMASMNMMNNLNMGGNMNINNELLQFMMKGQMQRHGKNNLFLFN
jgi:hypothetical protein